MIQLILVLTFLHAASATSLSSNTLKVEPPGPTSSTLKGLWSLQAYRNQETDVLSDSLHVDFSGSFDWQKKFDDTLLVRVAPAVRLVSGRDVDVFSDRLPRDKVYAQEAKVLWTPVALFFMEGGALNQNFLENELIASARPFPALRAGLTSNTRRSEASLSAQVAVPTSYTLDAEATGSEPIPQFQSLSGILGWSGRDRLKVRGIANYYTYRDLPQIVAVRSKRYGNSVDLASSVTGRFREDFSGGGLTLEAEEAWRGWTVGARLQSIRNFATNADLGVGWTTSLRLERELGRKQSLGAQSFYYRIEPDTIPSLYSDATFSNNRIGWGANLYLDERNWRLRFKVSFFRDVPLYVNELMGDRSLFMVSVGGMSGESILTF